MESENDPLAEPAAEEARGPKPGRSFLPGLVVLLLAGALAGGLGFWLSSRAPLATVTRVGDRYALAVREGGKIALAFGPDCHSPLVAPTEQQDLVLSWESGSQVHSATLEWSEGAIYLPDQRSLLGEGGSLILLPTGRCYSGDASAKPLLRIARFYGTHEDQPCVVWVYDYAGSSKHFRDCGFDDGFSPPERALPETTHDFDGWLYEERGAGWSRTLRLENNTGVAVYTLEREGKESRTVKLEHTATTPWSPGDPTPVAAGQ